MADGDFAYTRYVGIALGLISQEWGQLGLGDDPSVAASDDLETTIERITALLMIRIAAWIQPTGTFSDLSTTTICRKVLIDQEAWPASMTPEIIQELHGFVRRILSGYNPVPYHNFEHCYHVTVSTNKLLDMIVLPQPDEPRAYTYGLRDDPLMQFALVFSALVHDVEHQGIPNRQLAIEDDILAIQYNDTSIAEHRSLFLGFSEILKSDYQKLRSTVFPEKDDYRRFRSAVVNLVLNTDIASPERSQIGKSKWKEAFGDPYETVERKVLKQMGRRKSIARHGNPSRRASRRMSTQSIMSELTLDSPRAMDENELDDDESVSGTPDSSDAEDEASGNARSGAAVKGSPMLQSSDDLGPVFIAPLASGSRGRSPSARASTRSNSMEEDEVCTPGESNFAGMALKFHRRLSSIGPGNKSGSAAKRFRNTRLGLLRTVDLTGESLEAYQHIGARASATGAMNSAASVITQAPPEEVDVLKETVVMETIIKAADVAHNLQGWEQMAKWSNRLFLELKKAYVQGRGDDPQNGWFSNQIAFIEAYLLPLARRLDDTGVFGDRRGSIFAQIVEENKERWMKEGMSLTANIIQEGHKKFPEEESDDDD